MSYENKIQLNKIDYNKLKVSDWTKQHEEKFLICTLCDTLVNVDHSGMGPVNQYS